MGSWVTYGLGTENQNLPGFITICPTLAHGGANNWSSGVPAAAVTRARRSATPASPAREAIHPFISNTETPRDVQRLELDFAQEMSREQMQHTGPDAALEGRINSFELAFRMQTEAPESEDLSSETERRTSCTASKSDAPRTSAASA